MAVSNVDPGQGVKPAGGSNYGRKTDTQLIDEFNRNCLKTFAELVFGKGAKPGEEPTDYVYNYLINILSKDPDAHNISTNSLKKAIKAIKGDTKGEGDRIRLAVTLRREAARPGSPEAQLPRLKSDFILRCMKEYGRITGMNATIITPEVLAILINNNSKIPPEQLVAVEEYMAMNNFYSCDPNDPKEATAFEAAFMGHI